MRLRDLDAMFVRTIDDTRHRHVDTLAEANGVLFQCPCCAAGKPVEADADGWHGVHYVLCWFVGVDAARDPKPGRWTASGTGIDDLTLSPSVHLTGPGCGWHGWVKNGDAA